MNIRKYRLIDACKERREKEDRDARFPGMWCFVSVCGGLLSRAASLRGRALLRSCVPSPAPRPASLPVVALAFPGPSFPGFLCGLCVCRLPRFGRFGLVVFWPRASWSLALATLSSSHHRVHLAPDSSATIGGPPASSRPPKG